MTKRKTNLAVLYGGPSVEHDVSLQTGKVILAALDKNKYNVTPVAITKDAKWTLEGKLFDAEEALIQLKSRNIDVVFIAMHGTYGEDGTVQKLLESAKIPYTGSGVAASALAMDKIKTSQLFSSNGLKVPKFLNFSREKWQKNKEKISFPCVVKPAGGGSSVGISIVKKFDELEKAAQSAFSCDNNILVEEYLTGAEVTCAVLDEGKGKLPIALPPTEIIPKSSTFFDYAAKYIKGATDEITPPRLAQKIIKKIQDNALKAHKLVGCAGMSRTDMIVSGNDIYILEINTIPGMTETSLYPQAAAAVGISFPELLDKIITAAMD